MFRFFRRTRKQWSADQMRPTIRRARLDVEALHARVVPSVTPPIVNDQHQLVIEGSESADHVEVRQNGTEIDVTYNNATFQFDASTINQIVFNGHGGKDFFANFTNISAIADGGKGADELMGGSGDDNLSGGDGKDMIKGGGGDDTVHGGRGNDTLRGGQGNDHVSGDDGDDDESGGQGDDDIT